MAGFVPHWRRCFVDLEVQRTSGRAALEGVEAGQGWAARLDNHAEKPAGSTIPRRKTAQSRRGATAVEFALVAPVLFFLVLGMFQFGGLMMVQNVLTAAAREGTRVAALSTTTSSGPVIAAVEDRLSRGGVDPNLITIAVDPSSFSGLSQGDEVRVTVSGQTSQLAFLWPSSMPVDPLLIAEMTYNRE